MKPSIRIKNWKLFDTMRGHFTFELYKAMASDRNIYLLLGDLGFGVFNQHREDFPQRVINCGASEQAMMDIAVGLAYAGKKPFVYSITNFLLYRPFETLRTYINHEKLSVRLIGSGRDFDYEKDGWSHHSPDAKKILRTLPNIVTYWPKDKSEIPLLVDKMVSEEKPSFISLRR